MANWMHCNECFTFPSNSAGTFSFTSCGHVLCERCTGPIEHSGEQHRKVCPVCAKEAGFMAINRKMRPDIMSLFKPPGIIIQECLQRVNTVISFQAYHRDRLLKYHQDRFNKAMAYVKNLEKDLNTTKLIVKKLQEEKHHIQKDLEHEKTRIMDLTSRLDMTSRATHNSSIVHNSPSNESISMSATPSSIGHGRHQLTPPSYMVNHKGIRLRRIQPIVCANYSVGRPSSVANSSNSNFLSPSASFLHQRSPALMPGRITKGSVLPPSLGFEHRRH